MTAYKGTLKSKERPGEEIDFAPPKMTAWCIIWPHAVRVLDRDNLANPTGDLILRTGATLSAFWLCVCQGSSRQDPWGGKVPLFDPDIEPLALPFPFHPTLPSRQARLFLSSVILLSWQSLQPARAVHLCRLWLTRGSCTSSVIMARIFFYQVQPIDSLMLGNTHCLKPKGRC